MKEICGHQFPDDVAVEWLRELDATGKVLPAGPWDAEPYQIEWMYSGLQCFMYRNAVHAWCGAVAVTKWHKFWRSGDSGFQVHRAGKSFLTCGSPVSVSPDLWLFSFQCSMKGDLVPARFDGWFADLNRYRTVAYVAGEVESLARQLQGGGR